VDAKEVLKLFVNKKALLKGHFQLSSGLHSEKYLQCALVLQYPNLAEKLCKELAKKFRKEKITTVVGPALGGVIVSYEVARALKVRSLFAEREEGVMTLRRGFELTPNDKVLVVEDVITTGGSVNEVIKLVKAKGAKVVGLGSIIDRSAESINFDVPFKSLAKIEIETYPAQDCPLCQKGIPVYKPGSRPG
jgi:orotate phosphoribosyltransferase